MAFTRSLGHHVGVGDTSWPGWMRQGKLLSIWVSNSPTYRLDLYTHLQPLQDVFCDFIGACFPSQIRTDELAFCQPSIDSLVDLVRSIR